MASEWDIEDNSDKNGGITSILYKPKSEDSAIAHIKYLQSEDYDRMHVNQRQIEISIKDDDTFRHIEDFAKNELNDKEDSLLWVNKENKTIGLTEKLPLENYYQTSAEFASNVKKMLSKIDGIEEIGDNVLDSISSEINPNLRTISTEWDIKKTSAPGDRKTNLQYKPKNEDSAISKIEYSQMEDRDLSNVEERSLKVYVNDEEAFKKLKTFANENLKDKDKSSLAIDDKSRLIILSENLPENNAYTIDPEFKSAVRSFLSAIDEIEPIGDKALESLSQEFNLRNSVPEKEPDDSLVKHCIDAINSDKRLRKQIQEPEFKDTFGHYTEEINKARFNKLVDGDSKSR